MDLSLCDRIAKISEKGTLTVNHDEATMLSRQQTADSHNYSRKLRVLYVTNMDGTGGGAAHAVCALMLDIKKRYNVEPTFLAKRETEFTELCRKNGIEVLVQNYYSWAGSGDTWLNRLKLAVKKLFNTIMCVRRKMLRLTKDKHFDIIHTNSSVTEYGDIIAQHYAIPHVQHIRESGYWRYNCSEDYVRTVYARAAVNIVISKSNYDVYVNQRRLCPPENTRIIYNGVKVPEAYVKRAPDSEHIHFCMTGSLIPTKNQMMAVKAAEKLKASTDNFTLHLIGESRSSYQGQLKRFVHSHGLDDCVKFWGHRSDVGEILKDMDVGLMLSPREGFGRVTVEYMFNYMPVLGVNTGATPEIVIDGETGFLCGLNDTDKLAELMHKFITHPELIQVMGTKGREHAVKYFSLERNTDEIYALYQEILSRK